MKKKTTRAILRLVYDGEKKQFGMEENNAEKEPAKKNMESEDFLLICPAGAAGHHDI